MNLDGSPSGLRNQLEASLNSLNIETIDLYYLHTPDPKVPVADSIGEMAKFVQEGKVRYLGISNMSLDQILTAHSIHPIIASQDQYSLFYRQCEGDGRLALLRELGIALVAYSPLGNGILGGAKPGLEANDFRTNLPRFQGEQLDRNIALSERFQSLDREDKVMTKLWIETIDSPIGQISIVIDEDRLCALDFADYQPRMMKLLAQRYESVELVPHSNPFRVNRSIASLSSWRFNQLIRSPDRYSSPNSHLHRVIILYGSTFKRSHL